MKKIFKIVPTPKVGGPEEFTTAAINLFARYPATVRERAAAEIVERSDKPTIKFMRDVLDEVYEPTRREEGRKLRDEERARSLPPPDPTPSPEEMARRKEKVLNWRRLQDIPAEGLPRNAVQRQAILERAYRRNSALLEDLERRRARNQQRDAEMEREAQLGKDAELVPAMQEQQPTNSAATKDNPGCLTEQPQLGATQAGNTAMSETKTSLREEELPW